MQAGGTAALFIPDAIRRLERVGHGWLWNAVVRNWELNGVSPGMTSARACGRWLSEGRDETLKWRGHASMA